MKLAVWLKSRKPKRMTQDAFGMRIGVTQGRVSQIVRNGTSDLRMAMVIRDATDGDVTLADLLPPERVKATRQSDGVAA